MLVAGPLSTMIPAKDVVAKAGIKAIARAEVKRNIYEAPLVNKHIPYNWSGPEPPSILVAFPTRRDAL